MLKPSASCRCCLGRHIVERIASKRVAIEHNAV
jgi:hypothetical protein